MTSNTIKISGMIDLEITLPDGMKFQLSSDLGKAEPAKPVPAAYPDSAKGRQAEVVADFLKEQGKTGVTETQIRNRFSAIRSTEQLRSVLKLLPSMLYRKIDGLWTYQFS